MIAEACRPWAHQLELLQTIPGVGPKVAQVILAETGGDMSRFPSAAHLASWAGLAPGIFESAGKRHQPEAQHGNKWLTSMLVEAAGSVGRMKGKMRIKIPQLVEALTGHFNDQHAQLARTMLHRLELVEHALAELDAVIAVACRPWAHQLELLQTIPGVGEKVAQVIVAETGADMSRFPSAAHLAAWAGVAPAI